MPEGPEIRIMSDFINQKCFNKKFVSVYHVEKGNKPTLIQDQLNDFEIVSEFHGKKIILKLKSVLEIVPIYVFMGMSGSWKWINTDDWSDTKYTRLKFDTDDGYSLLLFGGYLGPKYSINGNFKSSKSGPDIIQEFDCFEKNIRNNLNNRDFDKPIFELLLEQKYFAGVGNYLRSTILYYADVNPFLNSREIISSNPNFLDLCRQILERSYQLNGGQLKDWTNPFQVTSDKFDKWVFYQKGNSIKDKNGRTFWYNSKWYK